MTSENNSTTINKQEKPLIPKRSNLNALACGFFALTMASPTTISTSKPVSYSTNPTKLAGNHYYNFEQFRRNKALLKSFKNLPSGWNGYNSEPISSALIDSLITLLIDLNLEYQPFISPSPYGSIQFEFSRFENLLEIEFMPTGEIQYYKELNGQEFEGIVNRTDLPNLIKSIYA